MKLTIENLGPIAEAREIEVRPMTIFSGPGNTGKSYLATLVYATVTALSGAGAAKAARDVLQGNGRRGKRGLEALASAPDGRRWVQAYLPLWAEAVAETWREEVGFCLGWEDQASLFGEGFRAVLADAAGELQVDLTSPENSRIGGDLLDAASRSAEERFLSHVAEADGDLTEFSLSAQELHRVFLQALFGGPVDACYMPHIRASLMQGHREVASASARRDSGADEGEAGKSVQHNGVIGRFLTGLHSIGGVPGAELPSAREPHTGRPDSAGFGREGREAIHDLGAEIEERILAGHIEIGKPSGGLPDFRFRPQGEGNEGPGLSLAQASSTVAELAPLALYIKHRLQPGDLLILEEPEAHLHPGAQQDIAKILTALANIGVRVLFTTHSHILLEQLSNFAQAAALQADFTAHLPAEKVACYQFCLQKGRKSREVAVKEFVYDTQNGFITDDHMAVATDLYNEGVNLGELQSRDGD